MQTAEPTWLFLLPRAHFAELIAADPKFLEQVAAVASERQARDRESS